MSLDMRQKTAHLQPDIRITTSGLCSAIATHFSVRGAKKVRSNVEGFWKWACGETKLTTTTAESLNESENQPKFDKSKVQPAMVDSEDTLKKVIEATKAESKKKQGFYIFDALLKDTPQLSKEHSST